jgi:GNAT superfamily N-acetyltransferase
VAAYQYAWRGDFANRELNVLHAEAFAYPVEDIDWQGQVQRHSLGWVTARDGSELIGFVNVPWDGGSHAFILDTIVSTRARRQGVGAQLVQVAAQQAGRAGCSVLHVDFVEALRPFYLDRCGFRPTAAGILALPRKADPVP